MAAFLTILHIVVCFILVLVVLLQAGKGAELGANFGGGSSTTLFGSRGAGNFLTKLTTVAAIIFMLTSIALTKFSTGGFGGSIVNEAPTKEEMPAKPKTMGGLPSAPGAPAKPEMPVMPAPQGGK